MSLSRIDNQTLYIPGTLSNEYKDLNSKTFVYTSDNYVRIELNDCINFLKSIEDNSIDIIVTDPAYSGMNNKLQLGKGRIVGEYKDKGTENGKWFNEFEDSEENYNKFLFECRRVLLMLLY